MSGKARMTDVCRRLKKEGFLVGQTRGGHLRFEHPEMQGAVFAPSTPSDLRSIANLCALLKRKPRVAKLR
jgi:predicted RNA binding protein YcfA (HicA-like mRNA interferase family)